MTLPPYWDAALLDLRARDPVLSGLIDAYPDAVLRTRGAPFETLARAIVGQQISVLAADRVWERFVARVHPAGGPIPPESVAAVPPDDLAPQCGLSRRKAEYILDLAAHFVSGRLDPDRWAERPDEEIIQELIQVRGIGRWTAEMFLFFNLRRPDIWPLDDIGLQKAVARHYLEGERPSREVLRQFGERFAPWRTVATWYLWRSLDPVVVQY
jgi:DNA-3-methyladenine glycosylase II